MRTISLSHSIPFLLVLLATQAESGAQLPQPPTPFATPVVGEVRTMRIGSLLSEPKAWDDAPAPTSPPPAVPSTGTTPAPVPPTVLFPPYAKDDASNWPNVYTPFTVQASWNDWLFTDPLFRARDYANRGIWLHGAGLAGVGNPVSGVNKTRSANRVNPNEAITYNGARGSAVLRAGAPDEKTRLRATGSAHLSATTFSMRKTDNGKWDATNLNNPAESGASFFAAWNVGGTGFRGIEDYIGISRELVPLRAAAGDGAPTQLLNARYTATREDDIWDISPAVVKNMVSSMNTVHLDGGHEPSDPEGNQKSLVSVDTAAGVRGGLVTRRIDGRTVAIPVGMEVRSALLKTPVFIQSPDRTCAETPTPPKASVFGHTETDDSTALADWASLEIEAPNIPEGVQIGASTGVWIDDLSPAQAGGNPVQVAAAMGIVVPTPASGPPALSVEQDASLIARGDTHLGFTPNDGNESYSTLYINDLLHLEPRETPPVFDGQLGAERGGAVYFDATLNRICVSIPIKIGDDEDATDPAVVWMPLAVEPEGTPSNTATSYIRPRIDLDGGTADCSVGIRKSHFPTTEVNFYWRRPGYGYDKLGRTEWQSVPGNPQTSEVVLFDASIFMSEGPDGIVPSSLPNVVVHVMAIDTGTGEVAGLAFDRWPDNEKRDAHATVKDLLLGRVASSANLGSFPALVGGDNRSDAADLKRCAPEPPPPPESLELTPPPPSYTENETSY